MKSEIATVLGFSIVMAASWLPRKLQSLWVGLAWLGGIWWGIYICD